jgi:hypothetical protein
MVGNVRLGWMGECGSSHRMPTFIPSFHTGPAHAADRVVALGCKQGEAGWTCDSGLFFGRPRSSAPFPTRDMLASYGPAGMRCWKVFRPGWRLDYLLHANTLISSFVEYG